MSSEKYEVTVYDRAPSTASVSVAQIERYLQRTGWGYRGTLYNGSAWRADGGMYVVTGLYAASMSKAVEMIASYEERQPSAVLADIAREIDA